VRVARDEIEVVLFDLGGVLVELNGVASMRELAGIESEDELWRRWLSCRWVRSFERGECSADDFASGVVEDWQLTVTPAAFFEAFAAWPAGLYPGAEDLVARVRERVPTGYLSNTNAGHWDAHFSQWPIMDAFDYRFLSFELGVLKPDRDLFDRVAQLVPARPDRILFLDDNLLNVEGAIEAGFAAAHVRGVAEAEQALVAAGVLPGSA
jgi:HAD superfamily hydrolase (TIGR01509 family)